MGQSFFDWSGWIFGALGVIFGIIQFVEKKKYKDKLKIEINRNSNNQTSGNQNSTGEKSVNMRDNHGGFTIN